MHFAIAPFGVEPLGGQVVVESVDEARELLHKVADSRSLAANEVRGNIYLALGNLSVSEGKIKQGDLVVTEAIGGGLAWGSVVVRW